MHIIGAKQEDFRALDAELDFDPLTGTRQRMIVDTDGKMRFVTTQEDAGIREAAREEFNSHSRNDRIGEWRKTHTIPVLILYDLMRKGIWGDRTARKRWLNSEAAAPYRTHWARY